jgi:hypothetical protein
MTMPRLSEVRFRGRRLSLRALSQKEGFLGKADIPSVHLDLC